MNYPLVSTLGEALAILADETGRPWSRTVFFDAVVEHGLPMTSATPQHARPVMNTTRDVIDADFAFVGRRHLASMTTKQIADLGVHGTSSTKLIALEPSDAGYMSWPEIKRRRAYLNRSSYTPAAWNEKWPDAPWDHGELMGDCDYAQFSEPVEITYDSCRVPRETIEELVALSAPRQKMPSPETAPARDDSKPNTLVGSPVPLVSRIHKIKIFALDTPIQKAIKLAGSTNTGPVFLHLRELALEGALPFTGEVGDHQLYYTNDANERAFLTKEGLGKRLIKYRKINFL